MNRPRLRIRVRGIAVAALAFALMFATEAELPANEPPPSVTKTIRGRVVWLAEAMTRLHGINSVPESQERVLALETDDGELHPIVEDIRGRAFRRDERLRKMNVELLVRQHRGSPMVQVVRVFEMTKEGKSEVDYWCEICSIAMFELKECDCCQGPIEFRRQPVKGQ
ncbi:MAG: hypothetical protein H8E66_19830 [Planctomycetes bacterium]|nr:hypothetical protein [Planctomycetota bacterium]